MQPDTHEVGRAGHKFSEEGSQRPTPCRRSGMDSETLRASHCACVGTLQLRQFRSHSSAVVVESADSISLPDFLADRARRATDTRLFLDGAGGLLLFGAAVALRPHWWVVLAAVGVCLFAFALWGIADRELAERHAHIARVGSGLLRAARLAAVIAGTAAALIAIYGGVALTLGTWVS